MVASSIAVLLSVFSVVRTNSILEVSYYYYYFTFQFFQNCEGSFIVYKCKFICFGTLLFVFSIALVSNGTPILIENLTLLFLMDDCT